MTTEKQIALPTIKEKTHLNGNSSGLRHNMQKLN
nr:MAG TPA: hypothetical protein [Caudoviricetes sp.]